MRPRASNQGTNCPLLNAFRESWDLSPRGVAQGNDRIWQVSLMDYALGYFDDETCRVEPIKKSVRLESVTHVPGMNCLRVRPLRVGGESGRLDFGAVF
jgi:hypothetical protein